MSHVRRSRAGDHSAAIGALGVTDAPEGAMHRDQAALAVSFAVIRLRQEGSAELCDLRERLRVLGVCVLGVAGDRILHYVFPAFRIGGVCGSIIVINSYVAAGYKS